ncbi:hypothetical protein HDV63DRAFT_26908 [Trichoderma sp. SZMC 28014]
MQQQPLGLQLQARSSRCLWIWPPLLILGPANCKLQAETFPAAWRHLAHIGNQAVLQLPVASRHKPSKSAIWCLQSSGASGSSITRARAAALPWHWQRINKRPAHRKGRISARKLDGWTASGNRPGCGVGEQIAGLLVATWMDANLISDGICCDAGYHRWPRPGRHTCQSRAEYKDHHRANR